MIYFDHTIMIILATTGLLGISAGIMGCFLVLQKKSLFGDTMAHATLPGLTMIFFYTLHKNSWTLLLAGTTSALCAAFLMYQLERHTILKKDTILGVILATSFGLGTVFLSKIQAMANGSQAGLTKYLLGNASTLLHQDLYLISVITFLCILTVMLWFKEYKTILFDPEYAITCNIATQAITTVMLILTTLTIVIGLQTVGVILISALLIAPFCAARQWSNDYKTLIFLSAAFGMMATVFGTIISCHVPHLPTGPTIVVVATLFTLISILFAPRNTKIAKLTL
jgi:manganese/zinc/iron transport system permease protein